MYELTEPFEQMFIAHQEGASISEAVLGNEEYEKRVRMPKYNTPISMVDDYHVALKMMGRWKISNSRSFHADEADKCSRLEQDARNAIGPYCETKSIVGMDQGRPVVFPLDDRKPGALGPGVR
jgi:hypothetical protein